MQAHTVGMQFQASGELLGAGRTSQIAEQREETRARRLRECVNGSGRHVHNAKVSHTTTRKTITGLAGGTTPLSVSPATGPGNVVSLALRRPGSRPSAYVT